MKALIMNKQILLALGTIVFAGAALIYGTGAYFSDSASATANVFQAGTLTLKIAKDNAGTAVGGWLDEQNAAWNFTEMVPGGTPVEDAVWLKNEGSVDGQTLGVAMADASATVPDTAKQMRITEMSLGGVSLLTGGAGHNFALYEAPASCDIEVRFGNNDFDTISEAVNAAVANDVICVAPGNYSDSWETDNGTGFPIVVDVAGVEIVSTEGSDTTTIGGGVELAADNTALKGFTINSSAVNGGHPTAVYVNSADNVEIAFNEFDGATVAGDSRAIYTTSGHSVVDLSVEHNYIHDWNRGIWLNPTTNTTVENNTIAGVGNGINNDNPINSVVRYNKFSDHTGAAFAVLVNGGSESATFQSNEVADDSQGAGISQYGTGNISAQNNWWGDLDPSDQVNEGTGNVDYTPFAGAPIGGLINGADFNGNGFADLQDLNNSPILNAGVGLDGGEEKRFVMAVQLDGPTTGNEFQGASLTTDLVFTLNQQ